MHRQVVAHGPYRPSKVDQNMSLKLLKTCAKPVYTLPKSQLVAHILYAASTASPRQYGKVPGISPSHPHIHNQALSTIKRAFSPPLIHHLYTLYTRPITNTTTYTY